MVIIPRKSHGQTGVKLPDLGQTGPRGPQPPNSDLKVPIGSTRSRTHVLQVWSRSDGRIAHDWTVTETLALGLAFPEYPGLRFTIRQILYDPGNT